MLENLIDNIFVEFGGRIFQQTIGIPMGTNCAPLLADLFLYSYEAEFVQSLLQAGEKHLAQQFNFTYRYIDDVLSLKNTKFAEYLEFIYPRELKIKETTEAAASSSYLDCYLYIDNGKLTTRLYDQRDDFNFPIVNFPPWALFWTLNVQSFLKWTLKTYQNVWLCRLIKVFGLYTCLKVRYLSLGMVGEACLPSNAYYLRTPDYILCSGVHVCWSEHSDSPFVYGFMSLDYSFGTMTATTSFRSHWCTRISKSSCLP